MDSEQRARELLAQAAGVSVFELETAPGAPHVLVSAALRAIARALEQREAGHRPGCASSVPIELASCCQPRDVPDGLAELQEYVEEARIAYQGEHASGTFREIGKRLAALSAAPSGEVG